MSTRFDQNDVGKLVSLTMSKSTLKHCFEQGRGIIPYDQIQSHNFLVGTERSSLRRIVDVGVGLPRVDPEIVTDALRVDSITRRYRIRGVSETCVNVEMY